LLANGTLRGRHLGFDTLRYSTFDGSQRHKKLLLHRKETAMQIRCTYCQTMFPISRDETLAALERMEQENLKFYDAHCPKCRRANRVERFKLEISYPGWREAIKEMVKAASRTAQPEAVAPAPASKAEPAASPRKKHTHKAAAASSPKGKTVPAAKGTPKSAAGKKPAAISSPKGKTAPKPAVRPAPKAGKKPAASTNRPAAKPASMSVKKPAVASAKKPAAKPASKAAKKTVASPSAKKPAKKPASGAKKK
jgi:hypothetical protein